MALFVKRDEQRSQLQEKLAAELQEKLKTAQIKSDETEPAILDDAHVTRPAGLIIFVLLLLLVIAVVAVMFSLR